MNHASDPVSGDLVLVRVHSSRAAGGARHGVAGVVLEGVVEGAGEKVTAFRPGDIVRGTADMVFGGYACVPQNRLSRVYTP